MKARVRKLLEGRSAAFERGLDWMLRSEFMAAVSKAGAIGLWAVHTPPDDSVPRCGVAQMRTLSMEAGNLEPNGETVK